MQNTSLNDHVFLCEGHTECYRRHKKPSCAGGGNTKATLIAFSCTFGYLKLTVWVLSLLRFWEMEFQDYWPRREKVRASDSANSDGEVEWVKTESEAITNKACGWIQCGRWERPGGGRMHRKTSSGLPRSLVGSGGAGSTTPGFCDSEYAA